MEEKAGHYIYDVGTVGSSFSEKMSPYLTPYAQGHGES